MPTPVQTFQGEQSRTYSSTFHLRHNTRLTRATLPVRPGSQRRQPLPPQSDRFREASKNPRHPAPVVAHSVSSYRTTSHQAPEDVLPRDIGNGIPSGPRIPDNGQNDMFPQTRPPGGSARLRTRFDSPSTGPPPSLPPILPVRQSQSDAMDVDYGGSRGSRNDNAPYRQTGGMRSERIVEPVANAVPTGPRAFRPQPSPIVPLPIQGQPARLPPTPSVVSGAGPSTSLRERPETMVAPSRRPLAQAPPQGPRGFDSGRDINIGDSLIDRRRGAPIPPHQGPHRGPVSYVSDYFSTTDPSSTGTTGTSAFWYK